MHAIAGTLFASACLWHSVCSTILRLPCFTQADFKVFEIGKRLKDNVISRHYNTTDVQCTVMCVENRKCRSYNMNQANLICELNSKALMDNGMKLTDDIAWIYKSTDYSDLYIGPVCKDLKPCDNGVLCRDTCSPPYYQCIFCDDKHTGLHCDLPKEVNECQNNPCQNFGECVDKRVGYECTCGTGFTGRNCENYLNGCDSLPCFNGGTCHDTIGNYSCTCAPGFFGNHCTEYAGCSSNPCQFYQRCLSKSNHYSCDTLTNIAFSKTATQSSTFRRHVASNAVDGNKNTLVGKSSCTHTDHQWYPWWEVDFGSTYNIVGVEITNRGDCCGSRLKNFDVTVDGTLCFHRSEQIPQGSSLSIPCSSMLRGRRLKIQLKYMVALTLCEVVVYSPD